jgi:hypothetical protein
MAVVPSKIQVAPNIGATGTASGAAAIAASALNLAQAGDLLVWCGTGRGTSVAAPDSGTGGQTWTEVFSSTANPRSYSMFWAVFDGTWDGDLAGASVGSNPCTVEVSVWRAHNTGVTWSAELLAGPSGVGAPGSPFTCTVTSAAPTATDPAVIVGYLQTADDNTWGSIGGTGWDWIGSTTGYANDAFSDNSLATFYVLQAEAANPGSVTAQQTANGGDAYTRAMVAFTAAGGTEPGGSADAVPVAVHARAVAAAGSFGAIPGPISEAIETLRPNSTVYNGDTPPWVGDPDATDPHENVNETSPNDASVVYLPEGSAFFGSNLRLGLPAPVGTIRTGEDPSGHVVRVRIVSADDGVPIAPSGVPEWNLDLWQDSVAKAPRSSASAQLPDLTGAWQDVSYELTEAEAASISDYSLLRVSITARTQSTTYGVAVSSVSVDVPVLVAEDTPTAVPVSGHARAVAALGEFGGVTPTDGDAVPAATDVRAVPASGAFAGLAADGVPAQATGHSVAATGEFGALATTATPAAVRAQAAPSVGTSGALDAATSPVAVVARPLAASAGFDALDGDAAPAHVTAHALATTAALGVLAGDAVPAAAHVRSVPATASDITPITGDAAPAAGIVRSVAASGAFGPLPASAGPARVANRAVAASGLFGGLAGTTTPVSALAFAVPADAENDPLTIAGTAVPAAVTATASAGFGTFGELAGAMVPVQVSGLAVTATVVFGGLAALGVPVVVFATSKAAVLSFVDPDALRPMRATLTRAPWIEVRLTDAPAIGASLLRAPLLDAYRGDP